MDKDSTLNPELNKLQSQLSETLIARGGLADDFGRLLTELYTKHITLLTREVTSDKFLKDHVGYVNAVCNLNAYKTILKELQVAGSPLREQKLRQKLEEAESV
jgi:hypothetical protein